MNRQQELMALSQNVGYRDYIFNLSDGGTLDTNLQYAPGGWSDTEIPTYQRNELYKGVIRSAASVTLDFVKDGRQILIDAYNTYGVDANIILTVSKINSSTFLYEEYYTGLIDFSTYKESELYINVQVIDNSFTEKFKNRDSLSVNLRQLLSIESVEIAPFIKEVDYLIFPAYRIYGLGQWERRVTADFTSEHVVPLQLISSEFSEAQTPGNTLNDKTGAFFLEATEIRTLELSGDMKVVINLDVVVPDIRHELHLVILDSSGGIVSDAVINTLTKVNSDVMNRTFSVEEEITLQIGESALLQGEVFTTGSEPFTGRYMDTDGVFWQASQEIQSIVQSQAPSYEIYNAFLRCLQIITDLPNPFYSDFFGLTDSEGTQYPSDGEMLNITKGLFIRGYNVYNNVFNVSFMDLFTSMNAIYNLGVGIEGEIIRIEPTSYFFDLNVIADFSNVINTKLIELEVLPEWHYNEIKVGYDNYEYEETGGLKEYNTTSIYATVLVAIKNTLELVSPYRGDTQGINNLRLNPIYADPNASESGDDDIFAVASLRDYIYMKARTNQNFSVVGGGIDVDQSYNLDNTPARNIRRHGAVIRAGLERSDFSMLRWLENEKMNTLYTQKISETEPIYENADIRVSDLDNPMWWAEAYVCQVPIDRDQLVSIRANPTGIIKLASDKYGWILELSAGSENQQANLKLLRVNLNYVTPIEL